MKELSAQNLEIVAGGKKSDQLQQTLTQVQSSISSLANNNNNNSSNSSTTMLMLVLAMQNRNQTVVAAPACANCPTVVQPSFSFRARVRF